VMASSLMESRRMPNGETMVPLRVNADPTELRELLEELRKATDVTRLRTGDPDGQWLHERCLLFYAETCYKQNDIDAAIAEFAKQIELEDASDNLFLRAQRALGQIAFRAADYDEARRRFELAATRVPGALPRFERTLSLERAKLDLRLGDAVLAGRLLDKASPPSGAREGILSAKAKLERAHIDRLAENYLLALSAYQAVMRDEGAPAAERATAAYHVVVTTTDPLLLGLRDSDATDEAIDCLDLLVKAHPGHELIGITSSFATLIRDSPRGMPRGQDFDVELRSIEARLRRGRRIDLLAEFMHALSHGAEFYIAR
jgi:tetratricopeptide (TPR) repeat protein